MKTTEKEILQELFEGFDLQTVADDWFHLLNDDDENNLKTKLKPSKDLKENMKRLEREIAKAIADDWNSQVDKLNMKDI